MLNLPKNLFSIKANLNKKKFFFKIINFLLNKKILNLFLFDGPPFANGDLHLGHILNKTIKDILIKYFYKNKKILLNNLGWDCHGLPIEQLNLINNYFFKNCRYFVCNIIKKQKQHIININFFNLYYKYNTIIPKIESLSYKFFFSLLINNIIIKKHIPILWCYKCCSALSYSEILYKKTICSSFYFKIKIINFIIVVWTTTIWSLINNQALFFVKKYIYLIFSSKKNNLIFNFFLFLNIIKKIKIKGKITNFIKGYFFLKKKYIFFLKSILKFYNKKNDIINNNFIDINIGSGFVHCAPSNGIEDFNFYKKNNFINNYNRNFYVKLYKIFKHISIFFFNKIIFKFLNKRKIIFKKIFVIHNYMFCWRHKKPIFYYLSNQLYINLNFKIKKYCIKKILIKKIKNIFFFPLKIKKNFIYMIKFRNDWCISRQRFWGVPIYENIKYISYCKNLSKNFSSHIFFFINKKIKNIFDVWFDSSILTIFLNNKKIIIEGKDQLRGWYQSCIILNIFLNFNINIKFIITHNFCIDKQGNKFSKSKKNFQNLKKIIEINSNEIIKFFLIKYNFSKNIIFNELNLKNTIFSYKFIRNFLKFIINNFYKINFIKLKLLYLDLWIIKKTFLIKKIIKKNYLSYYFYNIIKIIKYYIFFLNNFYINYIKINLYISKLYSYIRISSLYTIYIILSFLKKELFPILFFTSLEIFKYIKKKKYIKQNIYFSFLIIFKKIKYSIFYFKNNILFFFKHELDTFLNNKISINNFFWNWYNKKYYLIINKKYYFCKFSQNNKHYKKISIYNNNCLNCIINQLHNFEEIRLLI
ncbi:MAG: class I tRNA ligase family protein [Candidatus Carsonella ruddii]